MNKRIIALLLLLLMVPALAQVNPGTTPLSGSKGGTNNAWMQFSGPTSSTIKTFFLPNTSDTIATLGTARTWTAAQSFTDADLILLGATSGNSVLHAPATSGGNVTFFTGNDNVVGRASTDTLTNKTFVCANQVSCVVRIGTDVSGLGSGVAAWLGTPTPANLNTALGVTIATLNTADQTLSGGANLTVFSIGTVSSGTTTIDCGKNPGQTLTNGGAFTLAAPASDGSCIVLVTNNGTAGAITFSGFSDGASVGDALTTTNGNKFSIHIWRVGGTSGHRVAAHQ